MTGQLFPTERVCGTCAHMEFAPGDPYNGRCPKLDLYVLAKTKACRTHYVPKGGRYDDAC